MIFVKEGAGEAVLFVGVNDITFVPVSWNLKTFLKQRKPW
jgi:hypothetical protein